MRHVEMQPDGAPAQQYSVNGAVILFMPDIPAFSVTACTSFWILRI